MLWELTPIDNLRSIRWAGNLFVLAIPDVLILRHPGAVNLGIRDLAITAHRDLGDANRLHNRRSAVWTFRLVRLRHPVENLKRVATSVTALIRLRAIRVRRHIQLSPFSGQNQ